MKAQMHNYSTWVTETDPVRIYQRCLEVLKESGFKVLQVVEHRFEPQGYTALYLLAESHLAIHTFPEHNQTYIELTSCVKEYYDNFIVNFNNKI